MNPLWTTINMLPMDLFHISFTLQIKLYKYKTTLQIQTLQYLYKI